MYLSTLGVLSAWGAIVAVGMNIIGDRYNVNWVVARSFYLVASRVVGIKIEVEGEEYLETRPSILVGNHQSMLDILYLGRQVLLFLLYVYWPQTTVMQNIPQTRYYHGEEGVAVVTSTWPIHVPLWRSLRRQRKQRQSRPIAASSMRDDQSHQHLSLDVPRRHTFHA